MDIFAHTLWTNALFYAKYADQRRKRYLAAFFGVVPDFIGFAPVFIYSIFAGRFGDPSAWPQDHWTVRFAEQAYNFTHSLVLFLVVLLFITIVGNLWFYFKGRGSVQTNTYKLWFFWPLLGWALHILIDIPTHPDFYQTPLLFPLSDFRVSGGISWGHPVFMAVNYSLLILAYIGLHFYHKRQLRHEMEKAKLKS